MIIMKHSESNYEQIKEGVERRMVNLEKLMIALIDLHDGPKNKPDPPHSHPHEQITYVAEGEILVVAGEASAKLGPGDMFAIPSGEPHAIQQLTEHVRLVDCFTPLREDFLKK